jgi:DNA-nicking Smr family endonuclease
MAKLKLDLHGIYNKDEEIEAALIGVINEAVRQRIALVEIIPGKGSGQLKKRVLRLLERPGIKRLYFRMKKDSGNFGRLFVEFRHKNTKSYHG